MGNTVYVVTEYKHLFAYDSGVTLRFKNKDWEISPCTLAVLQEEFRTKQISESDAMKLTKGVKIDNTLASVKTSLGIER